jgi:glucans biosynthesis protein
VADTRIGAVPKTGARRVVIDFEGEALKGLQAESGVQADVWSNTGKLLNPVAHPLATTGGWRIGFELDPGDAKAVELHARLKKDAQPLSETWLYRWTP